MKTIYVPSVLSEDKKLALEMPCESGEVSDGYHTFNELYEHRFWLFVALVKSLRPSFSFRAKANHDGEKWPGWFAVGVNLPKEHGQISYHLPDRFWPLLDHLATFERFPNYDGHTSQDVIE